MRPVALDGLFPFGHFDGLAEMHARELGCGGIGKVELAFNVIVDIAHEEIGRAVLREAAVELEAHLPWRVARELGLVPFHGQGEAGHEALDGARLLERLVALGSRQRQFGPLDLRQVEPGEVRGRLEGFAIVEGDEVLDARCVSSLAKRRYEVRELENAFNS